MSLSTKLTAYNIDSIQGLLKKNSTLSYFECIKNSAKAKLTGVCKNK